MKFLHIHPIVIICSDYERSKKFYVEVLDFKLILEVYRDERDSYKLDLEVDGVYQIVLFSFPNPQARPSSPEAASLRHFAFAVKDMEESVAYLRQRQLSVEDIRIAPLTNKGLLSSLIQVGCQLRFMRFSQMDRTGKEH